MDPDRTLDHILDTAKFILGGDAGDMFEESAEELAEAVLALDEWLRRRGFLPAAWRHESVEERR